MAMPGAPRMAMPLPPILGCLAGEKMSAPDLKMHLAATGPLLRAAPPAARMPPLSNPRTP